MEARLQGINWDGAEWWCQVRLGPEQCAGAFEQGLGWCCGGAPCLLQAGRGTSMSLMLAHGHAAWPLPHRGAPQLYLIQAVHSLTAGVQPRERPCLPHGQGRVPVQSEHRAVPVLRPPPSKVQGCCILAPKPSCLRVRLAPPGCGRPYAFLTMLFVRKLLFIVSAGAGVHEPPHPVHHPVPHRQPR